MNKIIKGIAGISKHTATSAVLKIADIIIQAGLNASGTFLPGAAYEFSTLSIGKLRDYIHNRDEQRIFEFHKMLLCRDDVVDGRILTGEIEEANYHALLNACLSDIEDEKTTPYANLTRAIALTKVPKELRRHFIFALKDISWDQLEKLQHIFVVDKYSVADAKGTLVPSIAVLIKLSGQPTDSLTYSALQSKGFLDDKGLTSIGRDFVNACSIEDDLNPGTFGYEHWSLNQCLIIQPNNSNRLSEEVLRQLEIHLEDHATKLAPTITSKFIFAMQHNDLTNCCIVLLRKSEHLETDTAEKIRELTDKKKTIQIIIDDKEPSPLNNTILEYPSITVKNSNIDANTKKAVEKVLDLLKYQ